VRRLWPWAVPVLMVPAAVAIGYAEGILPGGGDFSYWRAALLAPLIIAYALAIDPFVRRLRTGAERAIRPLTGIEEDAWQRMVTESEARGKMRSRLTSLAFGAGVVVVFHAWTAPFSKPLWAAYGIVSQAMMFSFIGWYAYHSIARAILLSRLQRNPLRLDLFESGQLEPVARWGLGVSFVFLLGIAVSIAFLPVEVLLMWENVVVCGALVAVAVLAFFMTMWTGPWPRRRPANWPWLALTWQRCLES